MARIKVTYLKEVTEILEWPDNEMDLFDEESLENNLDSQMTVHTDEVMSEGTITEVLVNGVKYEL